MSEPCELFDPAAARTLDVQVAAVHGDDGWQLMQQAGAAAWAFARRRWPQARHLLVLCGPGNNGGDALVLAGLALAQGCQVTVLHPTDHPPAAPLARRAAGLFVGAGGQMYRHDGELPPADLVIDGLLGLGLSRLVDGPLADLVAQVNGSGLPVLSLDVPSGVDARTGAVQGTAIQATCTLMFLLPHVGLYTGPALDVVGERELAPLALPAGVERPEGGVAHLAGLQDLCALLPPRRANAHKGQSGRAVMVGGNHGMGGAIALCGEAALRSGAGLVSVATRPAHVPALLARTPELMGCALETPDDLLPVLPGAGAVAIGPGLGKDAWARDLVQAVLVHEGPRVLDADALNLLAGSPRPLPGAILTPHPGEAARLLGIQTWQVQAARQAALMVLVERFQCVVVLKGAGTLVGAPGVRPWVIGAGNPGMAVGGMGDVLTGVIAALLAQGLSPLEAARGGALMHALAGDLAAGHHRRGMMPTDLLPHLRVLANPEVM